MKKSRLFAPFLMLLAGAVASITMFYFHYPAGQMLPRLLAVLLVFYIAGCFIQKKVLAFMNQIRENEEALEREAAAEREEVIEGEKQEVEERDEEDEE
ncbi:MAG: hypothetical protein K2P50_17445 [Lachnospiraceae bacterium]|nr:hypothetical protein [Lachnospiraceae bacterium]